MRLLVWNRLHYIKDPETECRRSQLNPTDQWVRKDVPHLRIVDDTLWSSVRRRQAVLDEQAVPASDGSTFQSKQRPKYLFSGRMRCDGCGGGVSMISATHVGCSNARNKGDALCAHRRTVKRTFVEAKVLDALGSQLMAPEAYATFVQGFTAECNKARSSRAAERDAQRDELRCVQRKIENLVTGLAEIGGSSAIYVALKQAEARKLALEHELATAEEPAPKLNCIRHEHPTFRSRA